MASQPVRPIRIATGRGQRDDVIRTTLLCVLATLAFDVVNQLVFFESWAATLRSWAITAVVVVLIATPVTRAIGAAHLARFRASQTDPSPGPSTAARSALTQAGTGLPAAH